MCQLLLCSTRLETVLKASTTNLLAKQLAFPAAATHGGLLATAQQRRPSILALLDYCISVQVIYLNLYSLLEQSLAMDFLSRGLY
jgi:hypothetical protein